VPPRAPEECRRARAAVAAVFLTNGVLFSTVVPRYPEIKSDLELSNAALGSALAAFPLGALLAGLFAASLIRRYHSARVASSGLVALAVMIALVSVAANWVTLAAVLFVAGALDAVIDVAQNAHGLRVQRCYRRSIVNAFHGVWSIGAVAGGLLGAAAAGLEVPLPAHLVGVGAAFSVVALAAGRYLLPGPDDAGHTHEAQDLAASDGHAASPAAHAARRGAMRRSARHALVALGVLAACGAVVEDAGASWGALYLREEIGTTAATAGLAFVAFQTAMTAGRLLGDRGVDRFGSAKVVRSGGTLAAFAMGAALAVPTTATTLLGFALAGLGVSTLVPAAMHRADQLPGLPHGVGLMVVSWLLRVGFLLSPPLVGLAADATSLRVALLGVVLAGLVVTVVGCVLPGRSHS
jgi:MFS family permease